MIYDTQRLNELLLAAGIPIEAFSGVHAADGTIDWNSPEYEAQYGATAADVLANYTPPPDYDALKTALIAEYRASNLIAGSTIRQLRVWRKANLSDPIAALPSSATKTILQKMNQLLSEMVEGQQVANRYMGLDTTYDPPE